jgi:endonuclease/exonuclease/phosphatase family metal-dependent hydrolase
MFISLLALALGYNHMRDTLPLVFKNRDTALNKTGTNLKVLSYNVRVFNIYEWLSDPNTDKGIFNFIRSEHPDVICLQEFFTNKDSDFSPERLKVLFGETPYSHIEYSLKKSENTGFGIATFSRYPIVGRGVINFDGSPNLSIFTDILFNKDTIRIFNNHLQSINLRANNYAFLDSLQIRYDEKQLKELQDLSSKLKQAYIKRARQVKKVSSVMKESAHPLIVCGDFNDTPVSYAYNKIRGNLKDAWVESGKGRGNTYLGRLSFRIDFILYDPSFQALEFERVKTQLSDHYPIMAILKTYP